MTAHTDGEGTITGYIPAVPPACRCCGDTFAEMIDIRELTSDTPEWFCRDMGPCMERQAAIEAAKFREVIVGTVTDGTRTVPLYGTSGGTAPELLPESRHLLLPGPADEDES